MVRVVNRRKVLNFDGVVVICSYDVNVVVRLVVMDVGGKVYMLREVIGCEELY